MTPQQLGAIIKRTGVRKAQYRRGRSFPYWTEGYVLDRGYPRNKYHLKYRGETTLALRDEFQRERLDQRAREGMEKIRAALLAKGVTVEENGGDFIITLPGELD